MDIKIKEAYEYLKTIITDEPKVAIILGSGLGNFASMVKVIQEIEYSKIPHFKEITLSGHEGKLIYGEIENKKVLLMKGRYHYYEGYSLEEISLPIRVFALLGIKNLFLTNACGGISDNLNMGDLMIINDHIGFHLPSILRGKNEDEFGPRFVDMSNVYTPVLRLSAQNAAKKHKINITQGVYAYFQGPMYETPAEIRALKIIGADVVGMSTVPEAIIARHSGLNILAISVITNKAAGLVKQELSHQEVLIVASKAENSLSKIIVQVIADL